MHAHPSKPSRRRPLEVVDDATRLEPLQGIIEAGVRSELVAQALRAVVRRLREARTERDEELEHLHQDLMQIYTAARLQVDLSAARLRRGEPAPLLVHARSAFARFERLAHIWLLLARPHASTLGRESVNATELLEGLIELVRTEAAITGASVHLRAAPTVEVWLSASTLARLLHTRLTEALRAAGTGGTVELTLSPDAVITWRSKQASGHASRGSLLLPGVAHGPARHDHR